MIEDEILGIRGTDDIYDVMNHMLRRCSSRVKGPRKDVVE